MKTIRGELFLRYVTKYLSWTPQFQQTQRYPNILSCIVNNERNLAKDQPNKKYILALWYFSGLSKKWGLKKIYIVLDFQVQ